MPVTLVGVAGFEPTAFRSQSGRATKLRHTPSVRDVGYMPAGTASAALSWAARRAPIRPLRLRFRTRRRWPGSTAPAPAARTPEYRGVHGRGATRYDALHAGVALTR